MRKLIRGIIICTLILALMIAQIITVYAASAVIYVTADRTEAEPGDTVSYTVSLSPVSDMGTMQMVLDIPEGLTYVRGSGRLSDGLKNKLGFDYADFTEKSLMINGIASAADYSSSSETVLCTFSCIVDEGFNGKAEVGLSNLEFLSCKTWEDHTGDYTVSMTPVTVGKASGQDAGGSGDQQKPSDPAAADGQSDKDPSSGSSPGGSGEASQAETSDGQTDQSGVSGGSDANDSQNGASEGTVDEARNDNAQEEHASSVVWIIPVIAAALVIFFAILFIRRKRK